jgi:hypothetical protein
MPAELSRAPERADQHFPEGQKRMTQTNHRKQGQSVVEMALLMPVLIFILAIILDGGVALNAWLRVNTAARDGTRFVLDSGREADLRDLVLTKLQGLTNSAIDIYLIQGHTDGEGEITEENWEVTHVYGDREGGPSVTRAEIEEAMQTPEAAVVRRDAPFTIVEVDYVHAPLFLEFILGRQQLPMSSYAIVHQYSSLY